MANLNMVVTAQVHVAHMLSRVLARHERPFADGAGEGALASVRPLVNPQVALFAVRLATLRARERPKSRVRQGMAGQVRRRLELLAAVLAKVFHNGSTV